jgi:hypothetical protein
MSGGPRVISYGGGRQSTALVVLAAQGRLDEVMGGPVTDALFANVGDDSENPDTLKFVRGWVMPWAAANNVTVWELDRIKRDGSVETLLGRIVRPELRSIDIPVRMANGAPGRRNCTKDFKLQVVDRWIRKHGATADSPATVAVGFSTDEIERVGRRRNAPHGRTVYPLLELGLSTADCERIVMEAGLPRPPKSSCWFCPFHLPRTFAEMERDKPALFRRAVELERTLNGKRQALGKDEVYLTRFAMPLDRAVRDPRAQKNMAAPEMGEDGCDEGACFT